MKKRCIALLLCLNMIFSVVAQFIPVAFAMPEIQVTVTQDGQPVEEILINYTEKETLSAQVSEVEVESYQWQILFDMQNNIWVDIYDKTQPQAEFSHTVVKNMMDESDSAYIRCKAVTKQGVYYSAPVCVSVSFVDEQPETEREPMILLSDLEVIVPDDEQVKEEEQTETQPAEDEQKTETSADSEDVQQTENQPETQPSEDEQKTEISADSEDVQQEEQTETQPAEDEQKTETSADSEDVQQTENQTETQPAEDEQSTNSTYSAQTEQPQLIITEEAAEDIHALPAANDVVMLADDVDDTEYVNVTINYYDYVELRDNNTLREVYKPYVATIVKGSEFHQDVVSPSYMGYAPDLRAKDAEDNYSDAILEDAKSVKLNYDSVNENIEINVYYKPIDVQYAVRYFFQNINNDQYTEDVSLYRVDKAYTGKILGDEDLKIPDASAYKAVGFQKMHHIPTSVAADGSTVFECYYDRNYYLMRFNLDGGYGVDPIYARYGTPLVINKPVKHGYNFLGWDKLTVDTDDDEKPDEGDGIADTLPSTMPDEEQIYQALWGVIDTTYTVVYWRENADDNNYSYWGHDTKNAQSGDKVSGEDDIPASVTDGEGDYFTFNSQLTDKNVVVEGDGSTVVNVYYTRNYYKITFKATGLCTIPAGHVHNDSCYDYICHIHDENCEKVYTCNKPEHIHTAECTIVCGNTHTEHSEACCTITEHEKHTAECYDDLGKSYNSRPSNSLTGNPTEGRIYRVGNWPQYYYYVYIDGKWYDYEGSQSNGTTISPSCGLDFHTHGDGSCSCGNALHSHTTSCYSCKTEEHTHTEGVCYTYECDMGDHTHTDACRRLKCGITEGHTHSTNCNNSNRTNTVKVVRRKYDSSIVDIWPIKDDNSKEYSGYMWESDRTGDYYAFLEKIPGYDLELAVLNVGSYEYKWYYYLEILPGQNTDGLTIRQDGGKTYYEYLPITIKSTSNSLRLTYAEDYFPITGFEQRDDTVPSFSNRVAYLYYTRGLHTLSFSNNGVVIDDKTQNNVMYGQNLSGYYFEPDYPSNLEPNAYYFDGWYTVAECFNGTEVNWNTDTMPDSDLLLHAKWSPKLHDVKFFTSYDDMLAYEADNSKTSLVFQDKPDIPHGNVVSTVNKPTKTDSNMDVAWAGWFYMDGATKRAFIPTEIPIKKDMHIFAEWSSHSPQPYKISYKLYGTETKVADDTTGYAYGGSTRTFNAKIGAPHNQLYPEYNVQDNPYFPIVGSHSITIQYEANKDYDLLENNVFTFYYVQPVIPIQYEVRYVNKATGEIMGTKPGSTESALVTEKFRPFEGLVPDAFYKQLVLSVRYDEEQNTWVSDLSKNIITFYYTPNTENAYYAVHYMLEKVTADPNKDHADLDYYIDGSGDFEESGTHIEGIADVNSNVKIVPQTFPGFTLAESFTGNTPQVHRSVEYYVEYDSDGNTVGTDKNTVDEVLIDGSEDDYFEIKITNGGTELYIFYLRNEYNYEIRHLEYLTEKVLTKPDTDQPYSIKGTALYGATVTGNAETIKGYTLVNAQTSYDMVIRAEADNDNLVYNIITFYYSPTQYVVDYVNTTPDWGGLDNSKDVIASTGELKGSAPIVQPFSRFEGWYKDEDCTEPVTDEDGTIDAETNRFIPDKDKLSDTEANVFYAKFELLAADFTINRAGADDDTNQMFVYSVKNNDTGETINVTVQGNGSVTIKDLPFGTYTVTQQNNWSWRYSDEVQENVVFQETDGKTVHFGKKVDTQKWLNGNSLPKINKRGG